MANILHRCSQLPLYEARIGSASKAAARRSLADSVELCRRNPPTVPEDSAAGPMTRAPLNAAAACGATRCCWLARWPSDCAALALVAPVSSLAYELCRWGCPAFRGGARCALALMAARAAGTLTGLRSALRPCLEKRRGAAPACRPDDGVAREGRSRSADPRREGSSAAPSMSTTRCASAFPEPLHGRERPAPTLRRSRNGRPEPRGASQ